MNRLSVEIIYSQMNLQIVGDMFQYCKDHKKRQTPRVQFVSVAYNIYNIDTTVRFLSNR